MVSETAKRRNAGGTDYLRELSRMIRRIIR
jgi:hypothetical protein